MIDKKPWYFFFGLYFLSAATFTFPLILRLDADLIGWGGVDGPYYIWNISTFWTQIFNFQSPFYTKSIFFPIGANMFFTDYSIISSFFGLPFLSNLILYLNLWILIGLALSMLATFYLVKFLTNNIKVSLLAGFIYGLSPTMASFIYTQHNYFIIAAFLLPLITLSFLKFINKPSSYLKRFLILIWVLFFTNYYFFVLMLFILASLFLTLVIEDKKYLKNIFNKQRVSYYLKSSIIFILILLYVLILIFSHSKNLSSFSSTQSLYPLMCNADLAGFIAPAKENLLLSDFTKNFYTFLSLTENGDTPYYYLGLIFIMLSLGCVFFYYKKPYVLAFFTTALLILFFSLGLEIKFAGTGILRMDQTPFYYLSKLPFLGLIDCPIRFVIAIHLFLAVLSALFISYIYKYNKSLAKILLTISFLSLVFDYNVTNFPYTKMYVPEVYKIIKQYKDEKTVLELPSGLAESKGAYGYDWSIQGLHSYQMYWQSINQKPRVGGYTSRIPQSTYDFFKHETIVSDIFNLTSLDGYWSNQDFTLTEKKEFIKKFNLGYIIVGPTDRQQIFEKSVDQILDGIAYQKTILNGYILYRII